MSFSGSVLAYTYTKKPKQVSIDFPSLCTCLHTCMLHARVHECVLSHGLLKCVFGAGWAKGRNKWGPVQHWDCCMNHQGTYTVYRKRRPQLTALSLEVDHFPCNTEGNGVINSKNLRGFGSATKHNYDLIMWKKRGRCLLEENKWFSVRTVFCCLATIQT